MPTTLKDLVECYLVVGGKGFRRHSKIKSKDHAQVNCSDYEEVLVMRVHRELFAMGAQKCWCKRPRRV